TINQFDKAQSEEDVRKLWDAALSRGDIPGAYWATLTHPKSGHALTRYVFAEVHMLSHLVGAANRADIRRLAQLEAEKAALEEKGAKQQARLRDSLSERDATIRNLNRLLSERLAIQANEPDLSSESTQATLAKLIADLEQRLSLEQARRSKA